MNLNPLNTKSIGRIVLKNTLKTHYSLSALIDLIVKQVKEIPEHDKLKQDIELILMICSMIETVCSDSDVSINKLDAILGVYNQVFEMTVDDKLMLVNIVNFLHQNKTFVYKKGAFFTVIKALKWFISQAVNLSSNIASNKI